jgi:hypothetical protein
VEVRAFLSTVQRDVRGVDADNQLIGRRQTTGDELIEQHIMQRGGVLASGPRPIPDLRPLERETM